MINNSENKDYKDLMKNALLEINRLREELKERKNIKHEPIAIIGMACRFPGEAYNTEKFWDVLKNEKNTITEVPDTRWNINEYYDANQDLPGKMYTRFGSFLNSVDQFDPLFFGISPREAISMDPQQRILLEVTWEALQNAQQQHAELKGSKTGVFIGISTNEYGKYFLDKGNLENIDVYFTTGNALNAAAGRLSYILGLQGPSLAIDTACSSSLVAVHYACQSLRTGESTMAVAGGVNLILGPESTIALSKTKLLSPSGKCKTFDDAADGIVRGEGCGIVILKKLSDAIRDKDSVLAVIKGSAVNQDGASSGFTVPNGSSQKKLILEALANAGVSASQIDYVEAHGTGTALGDPIEVNALASVFGKDKTDENPLLIGSVKTNIGHLEAASGIASLIKVVLSLQKNTIPSHLNVVKPNSNIKWNEIPLKIVQQSIPWTYNLQKKKMAGVSAFGASGTNAHLIIEEAENKIDEIKTALPEIVFQRKRYWINTKTNFNSISTQQKTNFASSVYEVSWKLKPVKTKIEKAENKYWLIFSDDSIFKEDTKNQLAELGYKSIYVESGDEFKCENDTLFKIAPSNLDDYKKLLNSIPKENCYGIIHAWSLNNSKENIFSLEKIYDTQSYGCFSILTLIQALPHFKWKVLPKLFIVADSIYNPDLTSTLINFQDAPLWALGKVIMNEYPEYNCKLIDLSFSESDVVKTLVQELFVEDKEKEVVIRNKNRYVARLIKYKKETNAVQLHLQKLDKDASYIVTGGLGDLGIKVVHWLVSKGAKNIICIGRKNSISDYAKNTISDIEKEGVVIKVMQVDVADAKQMQDFFTEIKNTMPPLKGIIHSAGVVDDGMLMGQNIERFKNVFRPKVDGLWNLHLLSENISLDFFVCFSSMAAIWAFPGQGNYAAANAFMDALMKYRRQNGLAGTSINWGPWAEIGMAARLNAANQNRMHNNGIIPIAPDEAIQQLDTIILNGMSQAAVFTMDWKKIEKLVEHGGNPLLFEEFAQMESEAEKLKNTGFILKELEQLEIAKRKNYLLIYVQKEIAKVLAISDPTSIEERKPLFDLGLDSFMAVELKNKLENDLNIKLNASLLFNYPNLEAIINYLTSDVIPIKFFEKIEKNVFDKTALKLKNEPIVIVGMGCRFPGSANNIDDFWKLLYNNELAISEIPADRWNINEWYDPNINAKGKMYTKYGGFADKVQYFDAAFFGISPREALYMDPQQRLLLEVCWHALENANISPNDLYKSLTGVFIGLSSYDYASVIRNANKEINRYVVSGNAISVAAGRISYVLGLTGPSMAIDTSCSSSIVALHTACQSLRNNECNVALAGGVNLILSPEVTINLCEGKMLSADGLCKTFDDSANGYVRGEGCGIVVLKRLSDAIADKDTILACIKGSAVNHDGSSGGLTVPNGSAQKNVITKAMESSNVLPHEIDYIEAHGTATPLGDPIELEAIADVVKENYVQNQKKIKVGSVKTNIGHLEAAAGVAGLIKLVLSLQKESIPAHLNFKNPNQFISWKDSPIDIVTKNTAWKKSDKKRIAGLSSFGFSGTNAHIIVEEGIENTKAPQVNADLPSLLALSAKSEKALDDLIEIYIKYFKENKDLNFSDVCFTANTCRSHFKYRLALIANSVNEAVDVLIKIKNEPYTNNAKAHFHVMVSDVQAVISSPLGRLGGVFINGKEINWSEYYKDSKHNKVNLPLYPFQGEKYWIENNNPKTTEFKNENEKNEMIVKQDISESFLLMKLKSVLPEERYAILLEAIKIEVAKVMELPSIQLLDIEMGFIEMGIDSVMGIELKNKLEDSLEYTITTTVLFNYPTISSLTDFLLTEIFSEEEPIKEQATEILNTSLTTDVDSLTEEAAEKLLIQKLENIKF